VQKEAALSACKSQEKCYDADYKELVASIEAIEARHKTSMTVRVHGCVCVCVWHSYTNNRD
jgi:hypothetical protein